MNNLTVVHWNANGITNKVNELHAFIQNTKTNIILLNETHLLQSSKFKIPNYHTYRNDLTPKRGSIAHDGTAVLVHRSIVHKHIELNTSILIKINNIEILVSAVYEPPNAVLSPNDLDILTTSTEWSITAGDLNAKHPLWNSHSTNPVTKILYDHVQINDYVVLAPDTPTHFLSSPKYRPDVLDIGLLRIPYMRKCTTLTTSHLTTIRS